MGKDTLPQSDTPSATQIVDIQSRLSQPKPAPTKPHIQRSTAEHTSRPVRVITMTYESDIAQSIYNRTYERASLDLFVISTKPSRIMTPDQVKLVHQRCNELFDKTETDLADDITRAKVLMDNNGVTGLNEYTKPKTFQAEINCGRAERYLKLIRRLDEVIKHIDTLWLMGNIDDTNRNDRIKHSLPKPLPSSPVE